MSSETNYRTEFVVVLNNQPQGGFLNRARSPDTRVARRNGWGDDGDGGAFGALDFASDDAELSHRFLLPASPAAPSGDAGAARRRPFS